MPRHKDLYLLVTRGLIIFLLISQVYHPSDSFTPSQPLHPPPPHSKHSPSPHTNTSTRSADPTKPTTHSAQPLVFKQPHQVSNSTRENIADTRTAKVSPLQEHAFQSSWRPSPKPFLINRSNSNSNSYYDPTYPRYYPGQRPPSNYDDSYMYSNPSPVAQLPDKEAMISGRSSIPLAPPQLGHNTTASLIPGHNATASLHSPIPTAPPQIGISAMSTVPVQAVINVTPTAPPRGLLHKSPSKECHTSGSQAELASCVSSLESYQGTAMFNPPKQVEMKPQQERHSHNMVRNEEQSHVRCLSHSQMSGLAGEWFSSLNHEAAELHSITQPRAPESTQPIRETTPSGHHWSSATQESSPPGIVMSGRSTVSPINNSFEHNNPHLKRPHPQDEEEEGSSEEGGSTKRRRVEVSSVNKRMTRSAAKKEIKVASKSWLSRLPIVGSIFGSKVKEEDSDSEQYETCEEDQSEDDQ